MFGIDGPEFVIILLVLIVVIGPKDLPKMLRAFGKATARMRTTANEFRRQFDDAMREAELDDVQKTLSDVTDLDPRKKLTKIFDPIRDVAKDVRASIEVKPIENHDEVASKTSNDEITAIVEAPKNESASDTLSPVEIKSAEISQPLETLVTQDKSKKTDTASGFAKKQKKSTSKSSADAQPTKPKISGSSKVKAATAKKTTIAQKAPVKADKKMKTNKNRDQQS